MQRFHEIFGKKIFYDRAEMESIYLVEIIILSQNLVKPIVYIPPSRANNCIFRPILITHQMCQSSKLKSEKMRLL